MKNLLNSQSLSAALAFPAPLLFMWNRNWHMYSNSTLFISLVFAALAAIVIFGFLQCLRFCLLKVSGKKKLLADILFSACCAAMVSFLMATFLEQPLLVLIPDAAFRTAVLVSFFAVIFMSYLFLPAKVMNTFFMVWMLLSTAQTGLAMLREKEAQGAHGFQAVSFVKKPNLYVYILESYHGLEIMRDVYGIETAALEDYLMEKGFFIYEDSFSNSVTTLTSLTDLFTMRLYQYIPRGLHDVARRTRAILAGNNENTVFRTMKQNGYTTAFITREDHYYFHEKLRYLDVTDLSFNIANWRYALSPILECNTRLHRTLPAAYGVESRWSLYEAVSQTARELWQNQPFLICFLGGAKHAPLPPYSYRDAGQWVSSGFYAQEIERGNVEIQEVIDVILEKDPDALIILAGDHGAWRFRDIWIGYEGSPDRLHAFLMQEGITEEDLVKDLAGILLAIRVPKGKRDISARLPMSTVNIFHHVFAYLSEDPALLKKREKTLTSLYKDFIMAVDNKPISPFTRVPENLPVDDSVSAGRSVFSKDCRE